MTPREQLADKLVEAEQCLYHPFNKAAEEQAEQALVEAAAELRKVCRTCAKFEAVPPVDWLCHATGDSVPQDGSGGCSHGWTPRTDAPEAQS